MVDRKYTAEEVVSDGVSKKDIVNELHGRSSAARKFLVKELKVRVILSHTFKVFYFNFRTFIDIFEGSLPLSLFRFSENDVLPSEGLFINPPDESLSSVAAPCGWKILLCLWESWGMFYQRENPASSEFSAIWLWEGSCA